MDSFLQPLRDLPPRARRWSLVLVLLCGGILGYFVLRTFASPLHRQYQLDFGAAQWIEPAEFAPVAYFRKEIFLKYCTRAGLAGSRSNGLLQSHYQ